MAVNKLFPNQNSQFVDTRDGNVIGIHKVTLIGGSGNTDYLVVGAAQDAALLFADKTTSDPTFYLSGNNDSIVSIDAGTAGSEWIVVTRHSHVNFVDSD
jgi:hypothetical protein